MTASNRSSEITQLMRVVEDALWSIRHGYIVGVEATLRSALEKERLRKDYEGPHITYLH